MKLEKALSELSHLSQYVCQLLGLQKDPENKGYNLSNHSLERYCFKVINLQATPHAKLHDKYANLSAGVTKYRGLDKGSDRKPASVGVLGSVQQAGTRH